MNKIPERGDYWIAEIQMFPGDRLIRRPLQIYLINKNGDIGFMLIGDENVYWRSQIEWFDLIERIC